MTRSSPLNEYKAFNLKWIQKTLIFLFKVYYKDPNRASLWDGKLLVLRRRHVTQRSSIFVKTLICLSLVGVGQNSSVCSYQLWFDDNRKGQRLPVSPSEWVS